MKALTVQQPWAWAIVHGGKDVENRTQAWTHRGPLAIHAGLAKFDQSNLASRAHRAAHGSEISTELVFGAIIGVVDLVGAHHHIGSGDRNDCCDSPWAEHWTPGAGRLVHLELEYPRRLATPVSCRGSLGLWNLPTDVEQLVLAQLEEDTQ